MAVPPVVDPLTTLSNESSAVSKINLNAQRAADAISRALSTSDLTQNTMNVPLDMNSQRILNLPSPSFPTDPIRLVDKDIIKGDKGDKGDTGDPGPTLRGLTNAGGVIDDRPGFVTAENLFVGKDVIVPAGTYFIGSSITLNAFYRFQRGAVIKPANGVTVTFNGGISAGDYKIFDLSAGSTAKIAGLKTANVEWFTSAGNTGVSCEQDIQNAYDAVINAGVVNWIPKTYTFSGQVVNITRGQWSQGTNAIISFVGSGRQAFKFTGLPRSRFHGFNFKAFDRSILATASVILDIQAPFVSVENMKAEDAYIAVQFNGALGCSLTNFEFNDSVYAGVHFTNGNDHFVDNFLISSVTDFYEFTSATPFIVGETVTFKNGTTSVGTGTVLIALSPTKYRINTAYLVPIATQNVTGSTSGVTGTIKTVNLMHQGGGLRLTEHMEAVAVSNGDVIGGAYTAICFGTTRGQGLSPNYNKFVDVYFDTSKYGMTLENCIMNQFTSCWICSHGGNNVNCKNTIGMEFIGCESMNAQNAGYSFSTTCASYKIIGGKAANNNGIGIYCQGSKFLIQSVDTEIRPLYPAGNQLYGLTIDAACTSFQILNNRLAGNLTAPMVDNTPSTTDKRIVGNNGYKTSTRVTVRIPQGQSIGLAAHGLAFIPAPQDIILSDQVDRVSKGLNRVWSSAIPQTDATNVSIQADAAATADYFATVDISPSWAR